MNNFSIFGYAGKLGLSKRSRHIRAMEPAVLAGPREIAAGRPAVQAAASARREYSRLARILLQSPLASDRLFSVIVSMNASIASAW
jgi:hypothetical protein